VLIVENEANPWKQM